jgi:ABC-type transport system involved in cytochrome bd biosynthesis fused ATPase/permease subunit
VLKDLQQSFNSFLSDAKNFYDPSITKATESISPNLAAGSGIAAVGVILAAVTNGMVFDITGGVLTAAGLLFAGVSLGFKRRKILTEFEQEIEKGRNRFETEVSQHLKDYIQTIKERIEANFSNFDSHLEKEQIDLENYNNRMTEMSQKISAIDESIKSELAG